MLIHIEAELPSTMHLPVLSDDTLHFYTYPRTCILVVKEQCLILIDVPIQDLTQKLKIPQVFNLLIPKGNLSAWYDIDTKYLGKSYDETKALEILQNWYTTSTNHQPTIIHHSYLHQEQGRNLTFMLSTIRNTCSATISTPITSNL